jgi:hypothetical protein
LKSTDEDDAILKEVAKGFDVIQSNPRVHRFAEIKLCFLAALLQSVLLTMHLIKHLPDKCTS